MFVDFLKDFLDVRRRLCMSKCYWKNFTRCLQIQFRQSGISFGSTSIEMSLYFHWSGFHRFSSMFERCPQAQKWNSQTKFDLRHSNLFSDTFEAAVHEYNSSSSIYINRSKLSFLSRCSYVFVYFTDGPFNSTICSKHEKSIDVFMVYYYFHIISICY